VTGHRHPDTDEEDPLKFSFSDKAGRCCCTTHDGQHIGVGSVVCDDDAAIFWEIFSAFDDDADPRDFEYATSPEALDKMLSTVPPTAKYDQGNHQYAGY
jgi:hypothetical protein